MSWGTYIMAKYRPIHFNCPSCSTLYHVVKTEAGAVAIDSWVTAVLVTRRSLPAKSNSGSNILFCGKRRARIHARVQAPNE